MILFILILICAFVITMAFQIMGLTVLLGGAAAILVISIFCKKILDWIEHKRFKRKLDKM